MANPFEVREGIRHQRLPENNGPAPAEPKKGDSFVLATRKRTKQTYTVYLEKELMGQVQRLAKQRDVSASAVIEACVKLALEKMEG